MTNLVERLREEARELDFDCVCDLLNEAATEIENLLSTPSPAVVEALREFVRLATMAEPIPNSEWEACVDNGAAALAQAGQPPDGVVVPRRMLNRLGIVAERMRCRVDAIVEREGSVEKAVTSHGIGIGYLLAKEIFNACRAAADVLDGTGQPQEGWRDAALEEAAVMVEEVFDIGIADAIRRLKPRPPSGAAGGGGM